MEQKINITNIFTQIVFNAKISQSTVAQKCVSIEQTCKHKNHDCDLYGSLSAGSALVEEASPLVAYYAMCLCYPHCSVPAKWNAQSRSPRQQQSKHACTQVISIKCPNCKKMYTVVMNHDCDPQYGLLSAGSALVAYVLYRKQCCFGLLTL